MEPIKLGIVGLGRAGWDMHCRELESRKDKFQIVAVYDLLPERCQRAVERYGCKAYSSIEELVADPQVEIVDIATRSIDHFQHAKMALEAGKSVFLEKPMCVTYRQAKALVELANQAPGELYVRHNRRFEPAFQYIREVIESGILGEVYEVKLCRVFYQRRDDWQTLKKYGGGLLLNWGPHIIDHGLQLLGAPVKEMWSSLKRVAAAGDAEDYLKIVLRGENDRVVDIEISGGVALPAPEYVVWGTKGALECADEKVAKLRYLDPQVPLPPRVASDGTPTGYGTPEDLPWIEESKPAQPSQPVRMDMIWDALYSAVREGKPFPITLEEALQVMWVISEAKKGTPFAEE
ncbi:MAG: Gfo/Idh/MocA family oxidoreductase [Anaerolineae bacterium]|nr:Gfo/Idh/MocA family oxidoreductase [Anaerolineae bacterium]